ncbi:hypothetical protein Prudu_1457S001100 [Prunus dulcis]|uniref:Uncharacterized protein n=1 Tax=Prunus dulcis TaxID=3755 RepID=A0A5H2XR11_PRUDU|nr:hypothetical protein Prudu_1457S001100 [Prunus dulcis]
MKEKPSYTLFNILPYPYQISKLISISMALHGFIGTQIDSSHLLISSTKSSRAKPTSSQMFLLAISKAFRDEVGTFKEKVEYDDENKAATLLDWTEKCSSITRALRASVSSLKRLCGLSHT